MSYTITRIGNGEFETKTYNETDHWGRGEDAWAAGMLCGNLGCYCNKATLSEKYHIKKFDAKSSSGADAYFVLDMDTGEYFTSIGALLLNRLKKRGKVNVWNYTYVLNMSPETIKTLSKSIQDFINNAVEKVVASL